MKVERKLFGRCLIFGLFLLLMWCPVATAALIDNGDLTVSDTETGLMWQQYPWAGNINWQRALDYCEALVVPIGGYDDWRLPDINELQSLIDFNYTNPAIYNHNINGDYWYFPSYMSDNYWSSTTSANNTYYALCVGFGNGNVFDIQKSRSYYTLYVRAVRSGQSGLLDDSAILTISPNPNPTISEVMAGGTLYRYYKVTETASEDPISGKQIEVSGNGQSWSFESDSDGLLTIALAADDLGNPGDQIACTVSTEGAADVNFSVDILSRQSVSSYSFGSGISVGAGAVVGGKAGSKRGLVYQVENNFDIDPVSDDPVLVTRKSDISAGVKVSSPIGVKAPGVEADAEASLSALFTVANGYRFPDPYSKDEEMLRAGLLLVSFLHGANLSSPLTNVMIDYIIDNANSLYDQYRISREIGMGIVVEAGASIGMGLGFEDASNDNPFTCGLGASAELNLQLLLRTLASYSYNNEASQVDERGAGASLKVEGDLFAGANIGGAEDDIGYSVKTGIGGGIAGAFSMTIFCDNEDRLRGELAFSGSKDWGVSFFGTTLSESPGGTNTVTLSLDHDELVSLAEQLTNVAILCAYYSTSPVASALVMGPAQLKEDFVTLFNTLNTMTIGYRHELKHGQAFLFSPELKLAFGVNVSVGVSLEMEKSVGFLIDKGVMIGAFGDYYPEVSYAQDEYIPDVADLEFSTVMQDCAGGVFAAMKEVGKIVVETAKEVGGILIAPVKYIGKLLGRESVISRSFAPGEAEGEFVMNRAASLMDGSGQFGINGAFGFSPEGTLVSDICSSLDTVATVDNAEASITFSPGAATALLSVSYSDEEIVAVAEGDLQLFYWHAGNQVWVPLAGSTVDLANNRISAPISTLATFAVGILLPQGNIVVKVSPEDAEIGKTSEISAICTLICYGSGMTIDDGTLMTVDVKKRYATDDLPFGTIVTADADPDIEGVQVATINGRVDFKFTPPQEAGQGTVSISSIEGNAVGYRDFNVVEELDSDDNNLPDFWETAFFGDTGQDPGADPDQDGLSNREEYEQQTNPGSADTDNDGMDDLWEVENGTNPLLYDANGDEDLDGVTNQQKNYKDRIFYVSANCNGKDSCYSSIGAAYAAADSDCPEIRVESASFAEYLQINKDLNIILSGGWENDFGEANSQTIVNGDLVISAGCLQVDNLVIK